MSAAIYKALMAMSLEEEDEPFDLPDLPDHCSNDINELSLIDWSHPQPYVSENA